MNENSGNNHGDHAAIIDPSTADFTVIDLTASLNLSWEEPHDFSIHPVDDGGFEVSYYMMGSAQDGLYTSYVDAAMHGRLVT